MYPELPVILHTGYPGDYPEDAVRRDAAPFDYIVKGETAGLLTSARRAAEAFDRQRRTVVARIAEALGSAAPCPFTIILDGEAREVVLFDRVKDMTRDQLRAQLDETTPAFCRISPVVLHELADGGHALCPCLHTQGEAYFFFGISSRPCTLYQVPDSVLHAAAETLRRRLG